MYGVSKEWAGYSGKERESERETLKLPGERESQDCLLIRKGRGAR